LAKNPYIIWKEIDALEKQRLFFFLFQRKLKYSKTQGYPTAKLLSYLKLFEVIYTPLPPDVEMKRETYKQLKDFLKKFWSYYCTSTTLKQIMHKI